MRVYSPWSAAVRNCLYEQPSGIEAIQPRPMYGIFVAITVMNWTLASSGRVAM